MKKRSIWLAAATIVAAAFGVLPAASSEGPRVTVKADAAAGASAASSCSNGVDGRSVAGHGFVWCGLHWSAASLPAQFQVMGGTLPSGVTRSAFDAAARSAAATWNRAWPVTSPGGRRIAGCMTMAPLCAQSASTSSGVAARDGHNEIFFGTMPADVGDGTLGLASIWTDSGTSTIVEVDITLNVAKPWRVASGSALAVGEVPGLIGGACSTACGSSYDVESVLTHEFGHFLGLEDLGNGQSCWPGDLTESDDLHQTMYGCFWPGDTSRRTLGWGDAAGLQRVALAG